mmetsp:Transcript_159826/g.291730  ORF Transcript_159826/g.291730 Transcript_159826/m.291730 type:complete len:324 (-) Transcript_159826:120-1091(-)
MSRYSSFLCVLLWPWAQGLFLQERAYLSQVTRPSDKSVSADEVKSTLSSSTDGIKICIAVPISSVNENSHMENQTFGALARSVLDTWGVVHAPDVFQMVFPSSQDLEDFQQNYGGLGDPRLLVLGSGASTTRAEPTTPQRPSPLRIFEEFRKRNFLRMLGMKFNQSASPTLTSDCMWYVSADGDGYLNADALRTQLSELDHTVPYYLGSFAHPNPKWNASLYGGDWASGATGHVVSNALLDSVDWGACVQELQDRMERGEKGEKVWGWDDVETGACVWRHLPEAKRVILQHSLWSVARAEMRRFGRLLTAKIQSGQLSRQLIE